MFVYLELLIKHVLSFFLSLYLFVPRLGNVSQLNDLVDQTGAKLIIHCGDFGFYGKDTSLFCRHGNN
jgi:hypothetical protein